MEKNIIMKSLLHISSMCVLCQHATSNLQDHQSDMDISGTT
jgi:hypothetical protein